MPMLLGGILQLEAHIVEVTPCFVRMLTSFCPRRCHAAATTGNEEIMRMILDKSDKNVNRKLTATLRTPLHFAVESDSVEVTRRLLARKADVKMLSNPPGYNALHLAIRGNANTLLIDELLKSTKGYERQRVLEAMALGDMAIHMAAEFASISTIQKLHDYKADLEARTLTWRDTALIIAARKARSTAVHTLLERGAVVDATNATGATALIEAAGGGFPNTVEILLEYGADVTARKHIDKSTPLHLAARNAGLVACDCFIRVIKLLLSKGADVNAKNAKIQTPLDKAANRKDEETMKLLREYGGVLYKPNKDVLERYNAYFEPAPEEELAASLMDLTDSDSRKSSLSMSRTETKVSEVEAEVYARLDEVSTEGKVGDISEDVTSSKALK
jgi:ankyrin repeat protein